MLYVLERSGILPFPSFFDPGIHCQLTTHPQRSRSIALQASQFEKPGNAEGVATSNLLALCPCLKSSDQFLAKSVLLLLNHPPVQPLSID